MKIKINSCFTYRMIAGKHYLIPVGEAAKNWNAPLELTETAARIWISLEAGMPKEAIAKGLTEEFEVEPDAAERAVDQFALLLRKQGLLLESV